MKRWSDVILDALISLVLCAGMWASRAVAPAAFVTWDEPAWVYRSIKFLLALSRGDWADTFLTGHPGVVTMWTGAVSLTWHRLVTNAVSWSQLAAIDALPTLDVHDPQAIRQLVDLLPMAKGGIFVVHTLIALALYWLLKQLLNRPYALASVAFLALDPYYLALSRVLHIDALTSGFMLLALVSTFVYVSRGAKGYLVCAGAATGLAALTKSYGAFVAPAVLLALFVSHLRGTVPQEGNETEGGRAGRKTLRCARDVVLWGAVAGLVFFLLWPAMWVSPLETVKHMVRFSLEYATDPGDATASFFRGQVVSDLGPAFYLTNILFRVTPLVLVGGALALLVSLWIGGDGAKERRLAIVGLLVYSGIYFFLINLSSKKFDRYTLPIFLAVDLLAALGVVGAVEALLRLVGLRGENHTPTRQGVAASVALLLIVAQGYLLLAPLYPAHYVAYYNPWAGGAQEAVETIPVGWGEGIEKAAQYLAHKPHAEEITVATWAVAGVAPTFPGRLVKPTEENIPLADYVLFYVGDVQKQTPLVQQFQSQQEPEFMVEMNGLEYAWLYPNIYYVELSERLQEAGEAGDLIVLNSRSAFERNYRGDLPWYVIEGDSEAEVAAQLRRATEGDTEATRCIFYLRYDNGKELHTYIRRQLAQNALFLWQEPFAYGTLSCYQLAENARFRQVRALLGVDVDYGHRLRLINYGLSDSQVQYRQELGLGLLWRALRPLEEDYHLFMHLVDEEGRMWGQRDGRLQDTRGIPTSAWQEGSEHLCNYSVPLDAAIPPGQYWVALGVYRLDDLSRLDIIDRQEERQGTTYKLGPVQVVTPTVPPSIDDLAIQQRTDLRLGEGAQILGYTLSNQTPQSGEEVEITLFWRCLAEMDARYDLALRLERGGATVGFERVQPAGSRYPTDQWAPGEIFRYPQSLPIAADAGSGTYQVYVNFYEAGSDKPLVPEDVLLTELTVEHRERLFEAPEIEHPMSVTLGEGIEFLGYALERTTVKRGQTLGMTLYWRALRPMDTSYTVFTHLIDEEEIIRGQRDSIPVGGQRPTTGWAAGEVIVDAYELPVDESAAPGGHRIEVGMYDGATGERLPMTRADGTPIHERRILLEQPIQVGK
ncbi:MAG: glycosyltransferase family 39 protein [Chloroflexota bacterium]|nr:glycosyltransferase family 39 protein [Chloroflexota bacterium]